jgi:hypothetical protein
MNVLDLDVYIDILYIICAIYIFYNSSCAGYTVFIQKITVLANLRRLG